MTSSGKASDPRPSPEEAEQGCRPDANAIPTPPETASLIHQLQAHQIELENQNEALRRELAALQVFRRHYFEFYDSAPVGYLTLDDQGLILDANLTAAVLLGADKKTLRQRSLSHFVVPEDQDIYCRYFRQFLNNRQKHTLELRLLREDGGRLWCKLETSTTKAGADAYPRLSVMLSDITERKQTEEELQASQTRLRAIVDTAISGIITIDQRGMVQMFNKAAAEMFGYSEQEMIGNSINILMPSPHHEAHDGYLAAYLTTGHPKIIGAQRELQGRRRDGSLFPLSIGIGEFQEGEERYFTGILQDISEWKKAEQTLRESEERLALAMDASGEGFWDWDIQINRSIHNHKWYELLALEETAYTRTPGFFTTLLHKDDREAVLARIKDALVSGGRFRSEHRLRRSDGRYIWVQETGIVVKRDEAGKPLRMVGKFVDISARKRFEQQRREHQNQYERLLKLEVTHQTVAAIAHELNQPLSAAASYTDAAQQLLQAGNDQPEKLTYALKQSAEQIRRAGQAIHELFGFLHTGESSTTPLYLNQIVRNVVATLKEDGQLGEFTTVLRLAPELPKVEANALQLEKVLINLLRNGIEAMHGAGMGSGAIVVSVCTAASGNAALITVRDSGQGLTADTAQRIFEPFFSTKPHGLGMGLAISRALIEAQGGQLWYQPDEGPGATFHLTIPFAAELAQ